MIVPNMNLACVDCQKEGISLAQLLEYCQELNPHQRAVVINEEHQITTGENYLICLNVSSHVSEVKMRFYASLGLTRITHFPNIFSYNYSQKSPIYHSYVNIGMNEVRKKIAFLHFAPEKIVITSYDNYFGQRGREVEVLSTADIQSLVLYDYNYRSRWLQKLVRPRYLGELTTVTGKQYAFIWSGEGLLEYREKMHQLHFGGFHYRNEHHDALQDLFFSLPSSKVQIQRSGWKRTLAIIIHLCLCLGVLLLVSYLFLVIKGK